MAEPITGGTEKCYVRLAEYYQFPPDVFVSHLPEELKKSNHPYKVLWAHHAFDQPIFLDFDHNLVNHIVSPSQWNKDQFIKYHNVPEDKISVIPVGIYDIFNYSPNKTKTMIYTSIPYKGLEVLARVIPLILQRHPDTKFKIFSSMSLYGQLNDPYIELYEHLKKMPNVEYSAAVTQDELVRHYQESAFFVHPNIWEETFCQAMCEAMRCGAYPIISNIGALAEVAGERNASVVPIDGENTSKGWKVTDKFINDFADACCMALDYYDNKPQYFQEVSKLISDSIVERYSWKNIAKQWENLLGGGADTPVYYCMTSTKNTEQYTDLAIDTFFKYTQLQSQDKFFLIDNDGQYQLKQHSDRITIISNNQPKTFAQNMNLVMKLALVDNADFFGVSNDVVFTENWNVPFKNSKCVSIPLCNQKLHGESGSLKIQPVMDIEDFGGRETELNNFAKGIEPQHINGDAGIIGFYCFHIPNEIISKVGFLDENFVNGAEDTDYRLRATQQGYDVKVNTESYLIHFCGKSTWRSNEDREQTLIRERNYRNYFEQKWGKEMADKYLAVSSV